MEWIYQINFKGNLANGYQIYIYEFIDKDELDHTIRTNKLINILLAI